MTLVKYTGSIRETQRGSYRLLGDAFHTLIWETAEWTENEHDERPREQFYIMMLINIQYGLL